MKLALFALLLLLGVSISFGFFVNVNKSNSSVRVESVKPLSVEEASSIAPNSDYPLLAAAKLGSVKPLLDMVKPYSRLVDLVIIGSGAFVFVAVAFKLFRR